MQTSEATTTPWTNMVRRSMVSSETRHPTKSPQSVAPQRFPATANSRAKAKRLSCNRRLLDQGRPSVEESPQYPKNKLRMPQQTHDGLDASQLLLSRETIVKPTPGARGYRLDADWTTKTFVKLNQEWIGSTNFEVGQTYKDEYLQEQEGRSNNQQPKQKVSKHQISQQCKKEENTN